MERKTERKTGLLMPIFSLPSNQGIGDFGKHTFRMIDALSKNHFKIWQILPLNPVGYGNSPYQPYSSFAGDEIYISIDSLADYGLLKQSSIRNFNKFSNRVDYEGVRAFKEPYFKKAYRNFKKNFTQFEEEYRAFLNRAFWLYPYAVFMTLKEVNEGKPWQEWKVEHRDWIKNKQPLKEYEDKISYVQFLQFMFYKQWNEIKEYAVEHHIQIMGDIPFYVGLDSADVWEHQDEFLLDDEGYPTHIAGVPPDYFSEFGQRWGNPIYQWDVMKKKHYSFWVNRLKWNMGQYDIIRIDHFRAFDTYWKIPATCPTAQIGEWMLGPAYDFFDEIYRQLPKIEIVAEDLGDLRKQVLTLRDYYHLRGMNVLQFEMEPKLMRRTRKKHPILYTGTHDNDTIEGFYLDLSNNKKIALRRFFHNLGYDSRNFHKLAIHYCIDSHADIVIIPIQDILGLKKEARWNTPGTIGSPNWEWKVKNLKTFYEALPEISEWIQEAQRDI